MAAAADLPPFAVGLSHRPEWSWEVVRHRERFGALECIVENFAGRAGEAELVRLRSALPVLLHGVGLSLGSAEGTEEARLRHAARLVEIVEPPWFSEHIAFTRAGEIDVGHLAPLPFHRAAVAALKRNVAQLRRALPGVPLLLENIAYPFVLPGSEMTEAEFVRAVLDETGAGLLLDLENVHANARNHGYDPYAYLESLPLERVAEVHVAGGTEEPAGGGAFYADTHNRPVPEATWKLLEWLAPRTALQVVILERDDDLPPFADLLGELDRARSILERLSP